ncbi:MAG: M23 family metallopeptidase [Clostridiaceae bacterium]|nr:M23 family metallopeptidase [Clostridiaceae bacterium]
MKMNNKLIKLITNRGFYILLIIAVGIVGISGYVANLKNKFSGNTVLSVVSEPLQPKDQKVEKPITPLEVLPEQPHQPPQPPVPDPTPVVASVQAEWDLGIQLMPPLQGEFGTTFSGDELLYSKTMCDWRVHKGIDIRADVGTPVKAAADGIVTEVYTDAMMGFTVKILHEGGIETLYSNLQTGQLVEEQTDLNKGDVIGGVGTTAICEINEPPHLHFEVKQDGQHVDPLEYIGGI